MSDYEFLPLRDYLHAGIVLDKDRNAIDARVAKFVPFPVDDRLERIVRCEQRDRERRSHAS